MSLLPMGVLILILPCSSFGHYSSFLADAAEKVSAGGCVVVKFSTEVHVDEVKVIVGCSGGCFQGEQL